MIKREERYKGDEEEKGRRLKRWYIYMHCTM